MNRIRLSIDLPGITICPDYLRFTSRDRDVLMWKDFFLTYYIEDSLFELYVNKDQESKVLEGILKPSCSD